MKKIFSLLLLSCLFFSCKEKNEDVVSEPNKDGSIETVVSVRHEDEFDVLTTTHKVWANNKLDTTLVKTDTIKSLGTTLIEGVNANGEAEKTTGKKDYEFYITVK